jgi:hypothetical protein
MSLQQHGANGDLLTEGAPNLICHNPLLNVTVRKVDASDLDGRRRYLVLSLLALCLLLVGAPIISAPAQARSTVLLTLGVEASAIAGVGLGYFAAWLVEWRTKRQRGDPARSRAVQRPMIRG